MGGANIEDPGPGTRRLLDFGLAVARIRAGVAAAKAAGLPDFVLNARTDPVLFNIGGPEAAFTEAAKRAKAYHAAGAQSVFVPGLFAADAIARMAAAIVPAPPNVMVSTGRDRKSTRLNSSH